MLVVSEAEYVCVRVRDCVDRPDGTAEVVRGFEGARSTVPRLSARVYYILHLRGVVVCVCVDAGCAQEGDGCVSWTSTSKSF